MKEDCIFSGDNSREFWKAINDVQYEETRDALYTMGCHLQEFETKIDKLLTRVIQSDANKVCDDLHGQFISRRDTFCRHCGIYLRR